MKAYVSDTEDLKQDPSYQDTWDDMIINVSVNDLFNILPSPQLYNSSIICKKYLSWSRTFGSMHELFFFQVGGVFSLFATEIFFQLGSL